MRYNANKPQPLSQPFTPLATAEVALLLQMLVKDTGLLAMQVVSKITGTSGAADPLSYATACLLSQR